MANFTGGSFFRPSPRPFQWPTSSTLLWLLSFVSFSTSFRPPWHFCDWLSFHALKRLPFLLPVDALQLAGGSTLLLTVVWGLLFTYFPFLWLLHVPAVFCAFSAVDVRPLTSPCCYATPGLVTGIKLLVWLFLWARRFFGFSCPVLWGCLCCWQLGTLNLLLCLLGVSVRAYWRFPCLWIHSHKW